MTVKDFQKEVNSWSDRYGDFRSVEPGDIIKIKDNIVNITTGYDFYTGISYTGIKFASTYNDEIYRESDIDLSFIGNLTDKFEIGDNIIITLHVEESRQGTYTFEIIEEFEDIYPGYEYISYGYLAGDCISLA